MVEHTYSAQVPICKLLNICHMYRCYWCLPQVQLRLAYQIVQANHTSDISTVEVLPIVFWLFGTEATIIARYSLWPGKCKKFSWQIYATSQMSNQIETSDQQA